MDSIKKHKIFNRIKVGILEITNIFVKRFLTSLNFARLLSQQRDAKKSDISE